MGPSNLPAPTSSSTRLDGDPPRTAAGGASVAFLGFNLERASIGLLERLAVPTGRLSGALAALRARDDILEAVVLSTCNRVEIYAHLARYHGMADLHDFFVEWSGAAPATIAEVAYTAHGEVAAAHLFAVTSGLDSLVVGERQIQLQVKQALAAADEAGTCGHVLHALFQQALNVGKRTRADTGISDGASSMVDVGLDAVERTLGGLGGSCALIVGAGKMGGLAAVSVRGHVEAIIVASRTPDKRQRLAERVGGHQLDLAQIVDGLRRADIVVTSTGAPDPVITRRAVAAAMAARPERPLVLLDLALPRDVEASCRDVPGVTVFDIDAIRALTATSAAGGEAAKARAIVDAEVRRFAASSRSVVVGPTIAALRAKADEIRRAEVRRLAGRLSDLDDKERETVETLTRRIVNTLLHEPTVRLKHNAAERRDETHATALRELFDLDLNSI